MIKNSLIYMFTVFLAGFSVYLLADKILLPYIFYVDEVSVPNVIGHDVSTAKNLLLNNGLEVEIVPINSDKNDVIGEVNKVTRKLGGPIINKTVKIGTTIELQVFGEREHYIVPDLILESKNISISKLKSMGIKIDTIFYDYWNNICTSPNNINLDDSFDDVIDNCIKYDKNIIWKQFPEPNTKISKDDGIILYMSNGRFAPEFYDIPDLIGLNLEQAIKLINKSGLLLGSINHKTDSLNFKNKVVNQSLVGPSRITQKMNLDIE